MSILSLCFLWDKWFYYGMSIWTYISILLFTLWKKTSLPFKYIYYFRHVQYSGAAQDLIYSIDIKVFSYTNFLLIILDLERYISKCLEEFSHVSRTQPFYHSNNPGIWMHCNLPQEPHTLLPSNLRCDLAFDCTTDKNWGVGGEAQQKKKKKIRRGRWVFRGGRGKSHLVPSWRLGNIFYTQ